MPYTPTNWTEGVTKLGPTNMNHIETGISNATTTADAAVPKSTVSAAGDLIYATGSAAVTRLGIGTAYHTLYTNTGATAPQWGASTRSLCTGTGDMVYSSAANTLARLAAGTNGQVLTMTGGIPAWSSGSGITLTKYSKTTEKDVNTTVTKTDLLNGEITIAGNAMSSSGAIVINCGGDFRNSTGSDKTFTLELKLGSQVLWDSNASGNINTHASNRRGWHLHSVIKAMASTAAQSGSGLFHMGGINIAATTGTGGIVTGDISGPFRTAATTVDMTSAQTLTLSVTLSSSSISLGMRLGYADILVY